LTSDERKIHSQIKAMIRLTIPSISEEDLAAVEKVLASGFLVQGAQVARFEEAVAAHARVKHGVAVSNCTAALHLSLLALDVRPGDIVVVTAYSWPATANVIELCGAQPVFVDIRPDTFNLDAALLDETLRRLMGNAATARRVKAILPVHAFGQMADMAAILELTAPYGLPVVEDAACALGATLDGQQAGAWGELGCFSFHPRKAITTGEGGIVTTRDADVARRLQALRNHGQDPDASSPDFLMPGFNYRLTEFQAALGLTQMSKLERIITARREAAAYYDELLAQTEFQAPVVDKHCSHVYQSYVILLPEKIRSNRQALLKKARENGIEMTIGTWHIPMTTYYRNRYGFKTGDFPVTDQVFANSVTLPLYEGISKDEQAKVVEFLLEQISL
jgi:perosamine synthetase